jgi:glutamate dehydrogenase/leucine dehydrogenase
MGMKAAAKAYGSSLAGKRIGVQGVGHVGTCSLQKGRAPSSS